MKNFSQLGNKQQILAKQNVEQMIKDLVKEGFLDFGNGDQLTNKAIAYYVEAALEVSNFSKNGEIFKGIVN